jgi:transposase
MVVAKIIEPKTNNLIEYYIEPRLKDNLDTKIIPSLKSKDKDFVLCIDGKEGSGKSTLALQIGKYVDPSLDLSRIVFDAESFRQAIFKAKKGQVVIFDEAFTGLSSRASLSGINRALVSLMMQMRQKNLMVIMVLPTFFLLDKYVALFRARALIHVYEMSGNRGYFRLYNTKLKKLLYLLGKKDYSYGHKSVRTKFKGRFYGKFALGSDLLEEQYRKKKGKALEDTEKNPMSAGQAKYKEQRDILLWRLRKETKMTYQEMQSYLEEWDFTINYSQIRNICVKFGDKVEIVTETKQIDEKEQLNMPKKDIIDEKGQEIEENEQIEEEIDEIDTFDEENEENFDFD